MFYFIFPGVVQITKNEHRGHRDPPASGSRIAHTDCMEVAKALGVSPAGTDSVATADTTKRQSRPPSTRRLDTFGDALGYSVVGKGAEGPAEAGTGWGKLEQAARGLFVAEGDSAQRWRR